jgi:hypothetical protein
VEPEAGRPAMNTFQDIGSSGYKLYFTSRTGIAVVVTKFILQKREIGLSVLEVFRRFGYRLYFVNTIVVGK